MTGEIEAFGQMATAGLAASALENDGRSPRARGMTHRPAVEAHQPGDLAHGVCANCGTALMGAFCATCGQSAHVHRSVGHIFEEFLHGIWHFDSKAWRTLPRLVFQPGRLTRDYVYGKRAGYIAPLALFLFSIFLMFFVFGMLGGPGLGGAIGGTSDRLTEARSAVGEARRDVGDATREVAAAKAKANTAPAGLHAVDRSLAIRTATLAQAEAALAAATAAPVAAATASNKTWQEAIAEAARSGKVKIDTGFPTIDGNIRHALENPDLALYKIEQKAYKFSFLLIPLSLPALWLLFAFRRDVHTYDHVVFALYSLSFMSLLFIIIALLAKFDPTAVANVHGNDSRGNDVNFAGGIGSVLIFAVPVHMFVQLKGAYRLGVGGALWRTVVLTIASIITLGIFATLIVVVGLAD